MIAIDTNILVRVFLNDEPKSQIEASRKLISQTKEKIFVSSFTVLECAWVLKAKGFSSIKIAEILEKFLDTDGIEVSQRDVISEALTFLKDSSNKVGLGDCLIVADAIEHNARPLFTFDEALLKFSSYCKKPKS
jgi:predicted nucleic-acid-binding protein